MSNLRDPECGFHDHTQGRTLLGGDGFLGPGRHSRYGFPRPQVITGLWGSLEGAVTADRSEIWYEVNYQNIT